MCRGRERDRHESVSESENLVDTRVTETHISRPLDETLLTIPVLIKFDLPVQCRQHG